MICTKMNSPKDIINYSTQSQYFIYLIPTLTELPSRKDYLIIVLIK